MPSTILDEIVYLRNKATQMRHLPDEHGAAGNNSMAAKLARELEQKAIQLERQGRH